MKTFKKIAGLAIFLLFFAPLTQLMAQGGPPNPPGGPGSGSGVHPSVAVPPSAEAC